jgi:hypothetical protein
MHRLLKSLALVVFAACTSDPEPPSPAKAFVQAASPEEAGRYLFLMGGCNDCHTPGWAESNGKLAVDAWAVGSNIGYRGPWGTTYSANLRLSAAEHDEHEWVQLFREGAGLPPMPWQNYKTASDEDLLAIQRFLRSLGRRGEHERAPLPPGREPSTPYVDLVPKMPARSGP